MKHQYIEETLKEGDLIFTSINNFLYKAIEKSTQSKTSHVGILFRENQVWMVAESKVPVSRFSTLDNFIARSTNGWFCIRRLKKPLSATQICRLKSICKSRLGVGYDFSFNYDAKNTFCSKFVYDAFKDACDVKIGDVESFDTLMRKTPQVSTSFWRLWFCGCLPYQKLTITPHSQWIDSQLNEVVYHV